ncbi:MAG TPA: flagellar protein FlgN [Planctomycetota bacterium]|nr:flagellar protein FlgN [Planctomycetota bacterium]
MTQNVDRIAELLAQEIEAYAELLLVEREKEQAIISNDAEKLLDVLRREEPAAAHAAGLERQLLECRDAIAADAGRSSITLREIAAITDGEHAPALEALRTRLFGLAEEIRKINQTNYLLLKQSIELLDEVVSALLGDSPQCTTYGGKGRLHRGVAARTTFSLKA